MAQFGRGRGVAGDTKEEEDRRHELKREYEKTDLVRKADEEIAKKWKEAAE